MSSCSALTADDYTVGWVCALKIELAAAETLLDAKHPPLRRQRVHDDNCYTFGSVGHHNIVLSLLPISTYGKVSAATVAQQMRATFPNVGLWLMVGIGGGVPNQNGSDDIRLGDIVVSTPGDTHGGVIQYDLGKTLPGGQVHHKGRMNSPHQKFLTTIATMGAAHMGATKTPAFNELVRNVVANPDKGEFYGCFPGPMADHLYKADYEHRNMDMDCTDCDPGHLHVRQERPNTTPHVHLGLIASGDQVMKDAITRDTLARRFGIKCFEMEAAGMMNSLSCLVIRGICDYCDSHKSKGWQRYAALVAAAYAKEILNNIAVDERRPTAHTVKSFALDRKKQLLQWIGCQGVNIRGDLESSNRLRHGDTCSWLFRDERFVHWRDDLDNESTIWYNASLGSGKTILSAAVVEHLQSLGRKTAYFCYSFEDSARRNLRVGLRSIAGQLISLLQMDDLTDKIEAIRATEMTKEGELHMPDTLATVVFQEALRPFSRVYVVIDGLDECSDEGSIDDLASLISVPRLGVVKWFITSRDEKQIRDKFTRIRVLEMSPTPEILWSDINKYLSSGLQHVENVQIQPERSDMSRTDNINEWTTQCDGNFLYSKFVLETLQGYETPADKRKILANFPRNLQGYYLRTLVKLCDETAENRNLVRRTFVYLIYGEKSMTWSELQHALSIDRNRTRYDGDHIIQKGKIQQLCRSFLAPDRKSTTGDDDSTSVRLVHKTVHDFLVNGISNTDCKAGFLELDPAKLDCIKNIFPNPRDAIKEIGLDCLWYLGYTRYRDYNNAGDFYNRKAEDDVFLKYAAAFWFRILAHVQPDEEVESEVCRFLKSPNFWTCTSLQSFIAPHLFSRYRRASDHGYDMDLSQPGLMEASSYGHPVPNWLGTTSLGRKLDWDFYQFLKDWYEVLASQPGQLGYCVPMQKMSSGLGRCLTSNPRVKTCRGFENARAQWGTIIPAYKPIFNDGRLGIEIIHQDTSAGAGDKSIYYCRGQAFGKGDLVRQRIQDDALRRGDIVHFFQRGSDSKVEIWYLCNTPLRLERMIDGSCESFPAPPHWQESESKSPWVMIRNDELPTYSGDAILLHISRHPSVSLRDHDGEGSHFNDHGDTSVTAVDGDSDSDEYSDSMGKNDDEDDDEDDDDDDSSDGEDFSSSQGDGKHSSTERGCATSPSSKTEGIIMIRTSCPPSWISLEENKESSGSLGMAFRSKAQEVALWRPMDAWLSLISIADPSVRQVQKLPVDADVGAALKKWHRDLHFSDCGEYLYELDLLVLQGLKPSCRITLHTYRYPLGHGTNGPLVRVAAPQQITYQITRRLAGRSVDVLFTHWGTEELVIILPPFTCKPKIVKFSLIKANTTPSVEILNCPIYLPATMQPKSTLIYQNGLPGKKHKLYVYMLREWQGDSSDPQHSIKTLRPVVIQWLISRRSGDGWRPWDEEKDGQLEGWDEQEDLIRMLRGNYVDEGVRYSVPIRSGLDWTKKAYLSCC